MTQWSCCGVIVAILFSNVSQAGEVLLREAGTYEGFVKSLGPTAFYNFEGDGNDVSGNNLDALLVNSPSFVTGPAFSSGSGRAVSFNGSTQWANLNALVPELDHKAFSFSGWVRSTDTRGNKVLFAINNDAGTDNTLLMRVNANGTVRFEDIAFATRDPFSPAGLNNGDWRHVAYVSDGSQGQFFLDGASLGPQTISLPNGTSLKYSLAMEYDGAGASDHFMADYDNFAFFDRALTFDEVLSLADLDSVSVAPEPGTWALFGIGAIGLFIAGYRRHRRSKAMA